MSCGPCMRGYLPMHPCRHAELSQTGSLEIMKAWQTCMRPVLVSRFDMPVLCLADRRSDHHKDPGLGCEAADGGRGLQWHCVGSGNTVSPGERLGRPPAGEHHLFVRKPVTPGSWIMSSMHLNIAHFVKSFLAGNDGGKPTVMGAISAEVMSREGE